MFIETIPPQEATGSLEEIYSSLTKNRGKVADIYKAQSLNPEVMHQNMMLYIELMFGSSPLKRYQREMMAVIVAVYNKCEYSIAHHSEALSHFWKDERMINTIIDDHRKAPIGEGNLALCSYARALSANKSRKKIQKHVDRLKALGLSDREILDATLIIGYFNFKVRLVKGLGVELEPDGGTGYIYD